MKVGDSASCHSSCARTASWTSAARPFCVGVQQGRSVVFITSLTFSSRRFPMRPAGWRHFKSSGSKRRARAPSSYWRRASWTCGEPGSFRNKKKKKKARPLGGSWRTGPSSGPSRA